MIRTIAIIIGLFRSLCMIWLFILGSATIIFAQNALLVNTSNEKDLQSLNRTFGKIQLVDSIALTNAISAKIFELKKNGYLSCSLDELSRVDSSWQANIHLGPRYKFGTLELGEVEQGIIEETGFRILDLENQILQPTLIATTLSKLLEALENNGYPFASTQLVNSSIENEEITAALKVEKGSLISIDSLNVYGSANISKRLLSSYLGIKRGDRYDKSKILKIKSKLQQLPYLALNKNPTISFFNEEAVVNLDLKDRNASRFDFIIGVLQNESDDENRFSFIFDVNAEMFNKLGAGEHLSFQFKRLQPEVQELDLTFNYPYLLDLPFGLDLGFSLYRNTNRNVDVEADAGWQYFLGGNNYLKVSWDYYGSNLLDVDTSSVLRLKKLPSRLDLAYNAIGLGGNIETLDYRYNPRQGILWNINASVGVKEIKKNSNIINLIDESTDFSAAYDTLNLKGIQFQLRSELNYFIPLGYRSTLKTGLKSAIKIAEQQFFDNELYRIGGNKILRGFDEQSILTSTYNIFTLEYRLLLSQNSYLSAFMDYGIIKNNLVEEVDWDKPIGLGAGLNFETGAGVFGISTAVGKTTDVPFNFRNAKVHIGYLSVF